MDCGGYLVKEGCFLTTKSSHAKYTFMSEQLKELNTTPSLILVHGGWHGAWCWKKVLPLLHESNIKAIAIDLPGQGMDRKPLHSVQFIDYVNKIVDTALSIDGSVILVGHSSAGTAIAQAAEQLTNRKVLSLVFLDAFMPQSDESVFSLVEKFSASGVNTGALASCMKLSEDKLSTTLDLERVKDLLYHDCTEEDISYAKSHLGPQPLAPQATPAVLTDEVYGNIPKFYILCTEARDFDKSQMPDNLPVVKTFRIPSSHSPFFSRPDQLTGLLKEVYNAGMERM